MIKFTTTGITEHLSMLSSLSAMPHRIRGRTICEDTVGVEKWFHNRTYPKERTGAKNAIIINAQAKKGRKSFVLFEDEKKEMRGMIEHGLAAAVEVAKRGGSCEGIIVEAVDSAINYMIKKMKEHVEKGITVDGAPKPLKEKYARIKKALYPDAQILERTGQLLRSLVAKVIVDK